MPQIAGLAEPIFEMFQDVNLIARERGFETVGKANEKVVLIAGGRAGDDADGAARMDKRVVRAANLDERHYLCPGVNVVRLV